jgi:hypothetical protein
VTLIAKFAGPLRTSVAGVEGNLLQLEGADFAQAQVRIMVTLVDPKAAALPQALNGAEFALTRVADRYHLAGGGQQYEIAAAGCHVHRDLRVSLAHAVPPQAVRLRTRLLWSLGMLLARFPMTRRWLGRNTE